jgi:hypothetical protein
VPDQPGMPLTIRYTGSWLKFFSIGPGILGLLISALLVQLWFDSQLKMNRGFFWWAWILPFFFLVFTASDLAAKGRFRLTIDGDSVKYQGIFGESTLPRVGIAMLGWRPTARYTPGSLQFYDPDYKILMRIDSALLSTAQLTEISWFMNMPIEGPPAIT